MAVRYLRQAAYVLLIAVLTGGSLFHAFDGGASWPSMTVTLFCVGAGLFVFHLGLPVPTIGLVSLERVPQVGMLLVFEPVTAAALSSIASLIWPFTSPRYNQGSLKVAAMRGLHNASMTLAMMLLAGAVYRMLGGARPMQAVGIADIVPLLGLALTLQSVNLVMMAVFFWLDGRDARRLLTPLYAFSDLLFVPAGLLVALLYNAGPPMSFGLSVGLLILFVASFNASSRITSSSADQLAQLSKASAGGFVLRGAQRIDTLAESLLEQCHTLFRFGDFQFALYDRERGELDIRLHESRGERLPRLRRSVHASVFGMVVETGKPLLIADWESAPPEAAARADAATRADKSLMTVALGDAANHIIGLLSVQAREAGCFGPADLNVMQHLAESATTALADARTYEELDDYKLRLEQRVAERTLELEQANYEKERLLDELREKSLQLERQTREDPLTGLANRREFDEGFQREWLRAERQGDRFALVMLDLDHFKRINDSMGHAVGDEVLREVAIQMRRQCRAIDIIARYGGEEFALVLPDTDAAAAAAKVCERIRAEVEGYDWGRVHPQLRVTLSAGVAEWAAGLSAQKLLCEGDRRLYQAKRSGRNRVWARAMDDTSDVVS